MPLPTYDVDISFGSSGFIDVTQYVQSVSINRGTTSALDDYPAGSISVTFVNNARVFDPLNTSSPLWYGAGGYSVVQPGGKIQVSSNGVRIFTGFIQDWDFTFDESGLDGKATLTALDALFKVNNNVFLESTEGVVQDTGSRVKDILGKNGFGASEYTGVNFARTVVGADVHAGGDNVLAYLQNVARSEPADFFSNASAVLVLKDRTFQNYAWTNTVRNNLIVYPGTATQDIGENIYAPFGYNGWLYGGLSSSSSALFGGTVNQATINDIASPARYEMRFYEINKDKYNPYPAGTYPYGFSAYFKGEGLRSVNGGITIQLLLLDASGNTLQTNSISGTAVDASTWRQFTFSNTYSGTDVAGIDVRATTSGGTASSRFFIADGWQFERQLFPPDYFDGNYDVYTSSASTVYSNAWSGEPYKSYSGLVTSVRSAIAAPTIYSFADNNSQSVVNGTGIPFTDLDVVYGGEQLYNSIQVVGINAISTASDTALVARYGLRAYAQQDNLTTSLTRPAEIAAQYLTEYKLPEYRAEQITISLESLTTANQNRVLAIELRDIVRIVFRPSNIGTAVDKYYEVLGVVNDIDPESHRVTLRVSSLENLGITF